MDVFILMLRKMESKIKIIETVGYTLAVSTENITSAIKYKGRYHVEKGMIINVFPDYLCDLSDCRLILAHKPKGKSPKLDLPLLHETKIF